MVADRRQGDQESRSARNGEDLSRPHRLSPHRQKIFVFVITFFESKPDAMPVDFYSFVDSEIQMALQGSK
jgi:hypothetical protein